MHLHNQAPSSPRPQLLNGSQYGTYCNRRDHRHCCTTVDAPSEALEHGSSGLFPMMFGHTCDAVSRAFLLANCRILLCNNSRHFTAFLDGQSSAEAAALDTLQVVETSTTVPTVIAKVFGRRRISSQLLAASFPIRGGSYRYPLRRLYRSCRLVCTS